MRFYGASRPWGDILPRYAFLEQMLAGRRVLEVGCGDGTGSFFLSDRGAVQVVGVEREGSDLAAAMRHPVRDGVSFKVFNGRQLDVPSATFDVVIGLELSDRLDPGLLTEIDRVLVPGGHLVAALRNPQHRSLSSEELAAGATPPISYERFVASLQDHFARVSVVAQSPFIGFSIGWMGADSQDLPLEMDSAMVSEGGDEIAYYVAICGREPVSFDSQSLVQLPYAELIRDIDVSRAAVPAETRVAEPAGDTAHSAQLEQARGDLVERNKELHGVRTRLLEQEQITEQAEGRLDGLRQRLTQVERRLADTDRQAEVLRQELVRKERLIERLRTDLHHRSEDEVSIRRESLRQLLELPDNTDLNADELPQLLRVAISGQQARQQEMERLKSEKDSLGRSTDVLKERFGVVEQELRDTIKTVEDQRDEVDRRKSEVDEKTSWLEGARNEVERLEKALSERNQLFEEQAKRISKMERQWHNRARKRSDEEVLIASLREENKGLKRSIDRLGRELDESRRVVSGLDSEKRQLFAAHSLRQEQLDELRRQAEDLRSQVEARESEISAREAEFTGLRNRLAEAEDENKRLTGDTEERGRGLRHLQDQLEAALVREKNGVQECEVLQAELADREEGERQLRHRLTEEAGSRAGLERQLTEQVQNNRELESDLVALVNRLEDGQERDHDRQGLLDDLSGRLERQHQDLEDAREKIDELTKELYAARGKEEDLTAALDLMRTAVVENEQANAALETELSNLRLGESESNREVQGRLDRAELEVATLRRQLGDSQESGKRADDSLDRQRSEAGHQRRELERVQDRLAEAQDRLANAEAERERTIDLERELAWHREELDRVGAELQSRQEESEEVAWELEQVQEELVQLSDEIVRMQGQSVLAEREKDALLGERDGLRSELASLAVGTESPSERIEQLERSVRESESRIEAFERQMDERARDLEEARRRLEEEQASSRSATEEIERLRTELADRAGPAQEAVELAAEREKTLQTRLAAMQKQMAELEGHTGLELSSLGEQIRRREEQMQSLTVRLADLDEKRGWWEGQAASFERELGERDSQIVALQQAKSALLVEARSMEQALEQERAGAQSAGQKSAQVEERLAEIERRAEQAERRARLLEERQAVGAPAVAADRSAEVARRDAEVGGAQRRIAELEKELSEMRAERAKKNEQLHLAVAGFKQALAERDKHLDLVETALAERNERISTLEAKLASLLPQE